MHLIFNFNKQFSVLALKKKKEKEKKILFKITE